MNSSEASHEKTDDTPRFPFTESKESKFYRNFLKRWDEFYPDSAERSVEKEEEDAVEETTTETQTGTETGTEEKQKTEKKPKPEVNTEKETETTGTGQPKKIFDYKSKKYVEQN